MAVPSKNFTSIPDGDIDADSPLTETLMTQIRDSLTHLEEWLGHDYGATQNHDHDGTNSKLIPGGAISTTISSSGSQAVPDSSSYTPSTGVYNIGGSSLVFEGYVSSAWQKMHIGFTFFDGTNMRVTNSSGSSKTFYWQKF